MLAVKNDNFSAKTLQAGRTIPLVINTLFLSTNTPHMKPLQASKHSTSWIQKSANAVNWNDNAFECLLSPLLGFCHRKHQWFQLLQTCNQVRPHFPLVKVRRAWLDCGHALQLLQMPMQKVQSLVGVITTATFPSHTKSGNWKHRLFPLPVSQCSR